MTKPCVKCGSLERYASGTCKACQNMRDAVYAKSNPEKRKAIYAKHHILNAEKRKANAAKWRENHPAQVLVSVAKWSKANPEARRTYKQNRRAKIGGTLSPDLIPRLLAKQRGKCPCCYQPLGDDFHLDHVMPLALGGLNEDENMQLLRKACNLQKRATHPVEFMQRRGFLL